MKMRTAIPVMTPLQYNDFHLGRRAFALQFQATRSGPIRHNGHLRSRQVSLRCATRADLRMAVAKADVIKASRHARFRQVGDENYLLPGSTQRHRSRPVR